MEKLTMLGTGSAMVTKCYNTCFTLSKNNEYFLVDTGGGNTILTNLEKSDIPINKIHNVFISHEHNDHISGIVWIIRAVATEISKNNYEDNLHIYCHKNLEYIIRQICSLILQTRFTKYIDNRIFFCNIEDNTSFNISGIDITFFNIQSTKVIQFGFKANLSNGKTLVFLGDEPYHKEVFNYVNGCDYLLHEAFCLYSEKDIFHPYEKHHATVKDACESAESLDMKNLILFHTIDNDIKNRKSRYKEEGRKYFNGNLLIPDDLEVIELK
ncbi:MBL fold metallo-hydrolase [Clostridium sp. MB40-C1]|uniref:MBL fold metallo-hydrolase n=1 Tax=Clostridium sp. MB40-C1 TaxID=3070996 RepID=UPI0027DEE786|nr:MBL fold metallo-hydrolase [Clostridium sp. MB40-C1]WMJ79390.1 MBL fold metallo-hydrolase [Clostridium sp. MB40-C1]